MSLQEIIKKILAEADIEIKKYQAEWEDKKKEIEKKIKKSEEVEIQEIEDRKEKALEDVVNKVETMARQENARRLLATKRELLDRAMDTFLKSLIDSPEAFYRSVNEILIKKLPFSAGTLRVPSRRLDLMRQIASGFEVQADEKIGGGFVFSNGQVEVDNTFQNLVFSEYGSEIEMYFSDQLKLI